MLRVMDIGSLITGIGNLFMGLKAVKDGLSSVSTGLGLDFSAGTKQSHALLTDVNGPQGQIHPISENINDRAKYIADQIHKFTDAKILKSDPEALKKFLEIRQLTQQLVSSKCSKCKKCETVNVFSQLGAKYPFAKRGMVLGTLQESAVPPHWVCGSCQTQQPIAGTFWCTPEKNYRAEAETVFDFIRSNVRYTRDVTELDTYQSLLRTLEAQSGDCDCYTIALGTMLTTIGLPVLLRIMESKDPSTGQRAGTWNHIFLLAGLPPRAPTAWLPLDASVDKPAGWIAPKSMIYRHKDIQV